MSEVVFRRLQVYEFLYGIFYTIEGRRIIVVLASSTFANLPEYIDHFAAYLN